MAPELNLDELSRELATLSADRRQLLEKLLIQQGVDPDRLPIPRLDGNEPAPLSFGQEQLWVIERFEPGQSVYHMAAALELAGTLDVCRLASCLTQLIERHASLRTRFEERAGRPVQIEVPIQPIEVEPSPTESRRAALERAVAEVTKAFDLGVGEPLRVRLLELSSGSSLLVMTVHHIVCDRWSIGILIRELAALYRREGRPESLAALPIRYRDFATWQRQRWTPERLETALEYWRDRLSGELPSLELPLDRPRPKRAKREGRHLRLAVDSQAVPKLLRLCHEHGATAFTAWLALFKALLARTTGVEDLLVGAPDAGRDRPEVEGMVGYFVNTVVHRTDCGGDPSFRSLLDRVQQGVKADQGHRGIPFQKLVDDLRPERSPGLNPIFQVMLALQDLELPDFDLGPDCRGRIIDLPTGTAMFDLTLVVSGADAATETLWEYSTELFDHVTILRLAQRFRGLLQAVVADPDRPLWELPILGSGERQQLLVEWSRGQLRTPSERVSICGSFEAMVDRRSDAVAVILESEHVTYRELDRRSNRLARRLRALGVGAEVPVGVCLERSVQLVVGMLAILRAGGVYVPLEPETPEERLRTIARDAGLRWLLVNDASPIGSEVPALDLRSPDLEQPELDSQRLELQVDPQQLAYIIYTSGSTGRPNGVGVSHGAIAGHMGSVRSLYRTSVEDRVLQFTSANFDPAIEQTLNALTGGASLVLRGPDLWSRERLAEDSLNFGLSVFNFAPPVWRPLAGDWIAASGSQARLLILGADVLRADLVGELWRGLRVINAYGPTEAVITSVLFEVDDRGGRLPIGRPVGQRTARVLDRKGRLSPLGSAGELTHGGGQLARGYVGQPGLTAQRFIPDAFSRRYGSRCYRTGDRVRHLADGNLDFLGRSDQQVKIRGFRVEPSEIEARLLEMPTVQHAVVDVRGSGGERRLVAYLVTDGELPSAAELRRFVAARLSEYMVPSAFVSLDELPRLASGKVDRVGLPDPEPQVASRGEAPSGRAEEILADIWCEVFRLEKVGRDQSFFDLGGDSVLSIQVVSMAAARGLSLEPRQFFEHPTLAELASVAGEAERIEAEQGAVTGRVPLTPIQRWFFEQSFAAPEHWNQSVLLAIAEDLDPVILEPAVDALVSHHDALRHAFRQDLEGWRQEARPSSGVQRTLTIDLEALEARDRHRVRSKISNHLQASLDLATGSVFRVALFTPGVDGASELLLVAHHLIVDAVSWRLLLEDLGQLYQQREAGGPFELAPKTTSFQAWAKGLEARADDVGNEAVTTWQVLAAANEKDLGSSEDRSRSETYSVSRAQTHSTTLDHGLSKRLLTQVPSAYRTRTEEVLLTALLLAHQRLNGSSRLQIDLERHGREPLAGMDLARTVGWFTSVFPLGLEISEDEQPGSQLQDVKERLRAIERSGVDYGLLRYLSPSTEIRERMRGLSESRVVFNYLGQLDRGELNLAGRAVKWHRDDAIQDRSRHGHRSHGLEILAKIERGCLDVEWRFDRRWSQRQVAEWGEALLVELQGLIEHCTSVGVGRWTPSDFPLAKPSRRELDRVLVDHPRLEDLYPLSPAQEGMLFHTLSETGSGVYIEQLVIGLQGDLDSDALERSWQRVVDRHPAMRTAFAWDGLEQPMQAVVSDVAVDLVRLDWSSATEEEREVRLENLLREDRVRGHEPDRAPLMRWWLVAFGSGDIRIVWSVHHLILDGWSSPMVLEEVFSVYEAELQRRPVELPTRAPYRAYIAWLGEQDMNQAAEFWRRKLQGAAVTPLAVLDPSQQPTGASGHGELDLRLSEASAQALRALGKEHRLTLNTLVQAAWALLLYRRGGGKDLTFGITVSGRPAALQGVDGMIGMFINTLPLRLRVDPEARLGDWLREVQDCISDVRRFEHSPLVEIQRWSGLERGRPLFETLVLFYGFAESGSPRQVSERLRLTGVRGEEQTNYPFTLTALAGRELVLQVNFQRGLFRDVQIRGLLQEVAALLEGFKGALDGTYQELERALRAADRQQRAARAESLGRRRAEKFKKLRRKPRRKAPIASPGASTKEVAI